MSSSVSTESVLIRCIEQLLRPLIRLCVKNSVKLQELLEAVKVAYVNEAALELRRQGDEPSASRLSVMTGVHRKDVTRITKNPDSFSPGQNAIAKIMVQWQHAPRFKTKSGSPRVLSTEGRASEFAELVESVNGGDLSAYAVLYEMERMGIIERHGSRVKLAWRDYVPEVSLKDGLQMLAADTRDLYKAVEENIFDRQDTPNLHLKTVMDNIVPEAIPEIRKWLVDEGSRFHQRVRTFLAQFDRDICSTLRSSGEKVRVAFGSFSSLEKLV